MEQAPIGILLMAYGTPNSQDEIEEYYTHIRRGRKPAPEQLQELVDRYKAIGGLSPLLKITGEQAQGLEATLNQLGETSGVRYRVYQGMKHSRPFIADAVEEMKRDGITRGIGLVLAPHFSEMSVGTYIKTAQAAIGEQGDLQIHFIKDWHLHSLFIDAVAKRVGEALAQFTPEEQAKTKVIFSAHSLPQRILEWNDPYPEQLRETAQAVAEKMGLTEWLTAWQSAGRTEDPWLGPDILDTLRELYDNGWRNVVICPAGFVSDHLEVLFDIDVECRDLCAELGMKMVRTASLNASQDFVQALADVVRNAEGVGR